MRSSSQVLMVSWVEFHDGVGMTVSVVGCLSDIAAAMFCNKTQWIGLGGPLKKDGGRYQ